MVQEMISGQQACWRNAKSHKSRESKNEQDTVSLARTDPTHDWTSVDFCFRKQTLYGNKETAETKAAMTLNKDQHEPEIVVTAVPDSGMVTAVGIEEKQPAFGAGGPPGRGNEPPIPLGHSRFYCSKCRSVRIERRGVGLAPPARVRVC